MLTNYLPQKYYVYIVQCADGTYYTGKTNNLPRRLLQHNGLLMGGAKYTRARRPVELLFYEECMTNKYACHREGEIKQLSRSEKYELISCYNVAINNRWLQKTKAQGEANHTAYPI
jgi:putative endonuclease